MKRASPKILALGLPRSGSTWIFNALRALMGEESANVLSVYAENSEDFHSLDVQANRPFLVKLHYIDDCPAGILASFSPVISVRDPRDAVVSVMEMFGFGFTDASALVAKSLDGIDRLARCHGCMRYEELFADPHASVRRLETLGGLEPAPATRVAAIVASLAPGQIRLEISRLQKGGRIGPISQPFSHDAASHWHPGHLKDGRIGKWRDRLPAPQASQVVDRNIAFVEEFYPEILRA